MKQRAFDHVIVVMFENEYRGLVLQNETMKEIAAQGVNMTNYFGTYHPSQTNYIASIAGEQCGWSLDDPVWPLFRQNTIVDLLEDAGLGWKAYMEDFPEPPWNPQWATPQYSTSPGPKPPSEAPPTEWPPGKLPTYFQKHNPFASFLSDQFQASRWARIVDLKQFFEDVENGQLPEYSWVTPNIWNDGHYEQGTHEPATDRSILIEQIAHWLKNDFLGQLDFPGAGSKLPPKTLVVLTFDESDFEDTFYAGPNRIYTVLLGDMVKAGTCETEPYNHYSLLRTIEENFALGTLSKNDAGSNWFRFLCQETFSWSPPVPIPASTQGGVCSAAYDGALFLLTVGDSNQLLWQTYGDEPMGQDGKKTQDDKTKNWSEVSKIGQQTSGAFALASTGYGLLLVYQGLKSPDLFALTYTSHGWATEPIALGVKTSGHIALASLPGGGAVLVYTEPSSSSNAEAGVQLPMSSLLIAAPIQAPFQAKPQSLGRTTSGSLALSALGSTVYLVYSDDEGSSDPVNWQMRVVSFETADFNTVPNAGAGATVAYKWSPPPPPRPLPTSSAAQPFTLPPPPGSIYTVGQVSQNKGIVDSPPPMNPTLITPGSAIAMAELDGCIRLLANSAQTGFLLSETYSLSGVMTSKLPTTTDTALLPKLGHGLFTSKPREQDHEKDVYGTGYGTLMEVGWGPVEDLGSDFQSEKSAHLATAAYEGKLYMFFINKGSREIQMAIGQYNLG